MTDGASLQRRRAFERLLRRQGGVVSRAQAIDAGLDAATVDRRLATGRWRRVGPRVYQLAEHRETPRSRVTAAMLELTRRTIEAQDRVTVEGVVVTKKPLTVLDACASLGLADGARLMDSALLRGAVTLQGLRDVHLRYCGRPGTQIARELLALAAGGARSEAERMAHRTLRAARISGWTANRGVTVPGFGRIVGDIVFAEARVVVEVWAVHRDRRAFRRDAARQNALVAAGWTVIRTNWYELKEEPETVVTALRATVAYKI